MIHRITDRYIETICYADKYSPNEVRTDVQQESSRLGNAQVPSSVPGEFVEKIDRSLELAFIDAFRLVMILWPVLAWLSALMAALLVEKKLVQKE